MNLNDLEKQILETIATQLSIPFNSFCKNTELKDLNITDSDIVDLTMTLEEKFNLQIPDEEMEKMVKFEDVINYIKDNRN